MASDEYMSLCDVPFTKRTRKQWLRIMTLLRTYNPPPIVLKLQQTLMARYRGLITQRGVRAQTLTQPVILAPTAVTRKRR